MQASPAHSRPIILAGATGDLGHRIAHYLLEKGAAVRAIVRAGRRSEKLDSLRKAGVEIKEVDFSNAVALRDACVGGGCVVSALSGLREVIVDAQTALLKAAVEAGVPRFIPSDFCIDYRPLTPGTNRNLDLRREFNQRLDAAPIQATSILNGMFTDLLTGQAPVVLFGPKRVLYWGRADQPMDFTTIDNTAEYTAAAALDPAAPRYLRIAGEVATVRDIQRAASEATGKKFGLLRPGSVRLLSAIAKVARALAPKSDEIFPAWQGMQYLRDMLSGEAKLHNLNNDRYPHIRWTPVREVLQKKP